MRLREVLFVSIGLICFQTFSQDIQFNELIDQTSEQQRLIANDVHENTVNVESSAAKNKMQPSKIEPEFEIKLKKRKPAASSFKKVKRKKKKN